MINKVVVILLAGSLIAWLSIRNSPQTKAPLATSGVPLPTPSPTPVPEIPISISVMRAKSYPGSGVETVTELPDKPTYTQKVVSYQSEGLTIYALLLEPKGNVPAGGWPAIVFNHGYIPPDVYKTTERYLAYTDALARNGYVVFKPDYRGNGSSEGEPEGAYYSPAYTTDVLNAVASVKQVPTVNPARIGMWGHSMGGNIALRSIVLKPEEIKAAVIWGGVVGSYEDMFFNWRRKVPYRPSPRELSLRNRFRQEIVSKFGDPRQNPPFWQTVDPTAFISEIKTPVELHHGMMDDEVPAAFAEGLAEKLRAAGKTVELFTYTGGDHNLSAPHFNSAMNRTIDFFETYLK